MKSSRLIRNWLCWGEKCRKDTDAFIKARSASKYSINLEKEAFGLLCTSQHFELVSWSKVHPYKSTIANIMNTIYYGFFMTAKKLVKGHEYKEREIERLVDSYVETCLKSNLYLQRKAFMRLWILVNF